MLLWSGDYGLDLFNTWELTNERQTEYWTRFEDHVKPQEKPYREQVLSLRFETESSPPSHLPDLSKITHTEFWLPT